MSKSEVQSKSEDVPPGESIGDYSEDFDLSQFGYKAELEVRSSAKPIPANWSSDALGSGQWLGYHVPLW